MARRTTDVNRWQSAKEVVRNWMASWRGVTVAPATHSALSALRGSIDFGVSVNHDAAMKLTSFMSGVRYFADNVGSLPKLVKEDTAEGAKSLPHDHYLVRLLETPNSYSNKFDFWATLTTWLKGWGNAYALIERSAAGIPIALHPVHPQDVVVTLVDGKKWYKVRATDPKFSFLSGVYSDDDFIHVKEVTLDGINGIDMVRYNATILGKSIAQEAFAADFFKRKGQIKGVLEAEGGLGEDKYQKFMQHYVDSAGNFDTPLLEYGIKYKQLTVNPISAQLIQSETMSIQDIARALNIPPHMLADLSHATFSNIEHQTIQFVQYSLRPVVKKFEVELENKLLFSDQIGRYSIKFSLDGLLRGDTQARAAYYHNAILDGYMSRNEVRKLEGLDSASELGKFLYPSNEQVVGEEDNDE